MKKGFVRVNFVEGKIEMTPAFADAAGKIGSAEYKQFIEVKNNFPTFRIEVVIPKKKPGSRIKGLTMEYMEEYIRLNDDDQHTILSEFATLRGMKVEFGEDSKTAKLVDDPAKEIKAMKCYGEIRLWFLEKYHEAFDTYNKEADEIIKKAKDARKNRLAS